ncbi:alpha/beta hydrolase [Prosthecobacter sp.]|uniref:alpha/beta hydrolase family protein n=1 Tax=Prosthecobacter sp. TaxID=1965333 RepID=UPI002600C323|nr:alpha/beta hydrolase [Prosthecobacter sp.]
MRRVLFALVIPCLSFADDIPLIRGLSRTNLLEYRAADGSKRIAQSAADWEIRKREALHGFQQVTGPLPGPEMRCSLDPKISEETDCGSYVRRLITYTSQPGGQVPAYLCVPKSALNGGKTPAVLCLHPTENKIGFKVVVGLGGKPHRQYAAELAERGFVTLAPSYPLLADYQPNLKALKMPSGTMKAIWDNIRGLDYLDSLPFVDHSHGYGVIGHSLGGHNSIYTAVFDDRLKVIVSSCGFDSFLDYYGGNIKGWNQERYMSKMGDYLGRPQDVPFDFYELIACLAPRHVFVNAPLRDANFRWQSVDRIAGAALPLFALHHAESHLQIVHPDSEHDFPDAERFASYELIKRVLRPAQ